MSNLGALLSLLAVAGIYAAVLFYVASRTQELGNLVTTGVSPCGPVSMRWRWLTLFNNLLGHFAFLAAFAALLAMGSVEVGRAVTDDRVRMLANLIAVGAGFGSLFALSNFWVVLILASDLRKESQPPTNPTSA